VAIACVQPQNVRMAARPSAVFPPLSRCPDEVGLVGRLGSPAPEMGHTGVLI